MNLSHISLNWHLTGGKSQTLGCTGLSLGFYDFQKQLRKTATWSSQTGQYAGLRGKCHWRLLRVVKWTQHTSDLQEGNATVWCIPASRRASSAAARRGAEPQTPRRKLLGVWQHTIVADITPPRGEIKDLKVTQSLGKDYIDLPSILMCRLLLRHPGEVSTNAAEIVAARSNLLSWAERAVKAAPTAPALNGSLPHSAPARGLVSYYWHGAGGQCRDNLMRTTSVHQNVYVNVISDVFCLTALWPGSLG